MINSNNVLTSGQEDKQKDLENRLKYGDYENLALILGCSRDAARKRFKRGNEEAIVAMMKVVESRENLISNKE